MTYSQGEKAAAQTARLAANTIISDAMTKYGTDAWEVRDDIVALEAETAALESGSFVPATAVLADFLTADFDVDSGTTGDTPTATGLAVSVQASRSYIVEANLFVTATTNGGIELSWTVPTDATMTWQTNIYQAADNIVNDGENDATGACNYITAALSFDLITITGRLTVSTTVTGGLILLGAQDTSHADNTIIHEGSWLKLTPVQTAAS